MNYELLQERLKTLQAEKEKREILIGAELEKVRDAVQNPVGFIRNAVSEKFGSIRDVLEAFRLFRTIRKMKNSSSGDEKGKASL
jgi:hypothetical protein